MSRLADTLLDNKGFNQYGQAPAVDIRKGGQMGHAPVFDAYVSNASYIRRNLIAILIEAPRGSGGFGYDPVFLPEMSDLTFAELPLEKKNAVSHRAQAMWRLAQWLDEHHRRR